MSISEQMLARTNAVIALFDYLHYVQWFDEEGQKLQANNKQCR